MGTWPQNTDNILKQKTMSYHLKIILVPLIQASLQIHISDTQDALKKKTII